MRDSVQPPTDIGHRIVRSINQLRGSKAKLQMLFMELETIAALGVTALTRVPAMVERILRVSEHPSWALEHFDIGILRLLLRLSNNQWTDETLSRKNVQVMKSIAARAFSNSFNDERQYLEALQGYPLNYGEDLHALIESVDCPPTTFNSRVSDSLFTGGHASTGEIIISGICYSYNSDFLLSDEQWVRCYVATVAALGSPFSIEPSISPSKMRYVAQQLGVFFAAETTTRDAIVENATFAAEAWQHEQGRVHG